MAELPAIRAESLAKAYRIAHRSGAGGAYRTLREDLRRAAGSLLRGARRGNFETFWALRDVSFEVAEGEALGIIGRNGAGKSTLLKILSRITEPTSGRATLHGRVGSLLEVGTGFHPELTGRENVFLNGAILGMTRREVQGKFDEIVAFSEVERFLDTPVKRFSSGMHVRLAFAVAAHLDPEILIIDEVLAVGDAAFQRKCLGKMREVGRSGRTVLFVSHNMPVVASLCPKALYIEDGAVKAWGASGEVIPLYYAAGADRREFQGVRVRALVGGKDAGSAAWAPGLELSVELAWEPGRFPPGWECDLAFYTMEGVKVMALESARLPGFDSRDPGSGRIVFHLENPGFAGAPLRVDAGIRRAARERYTVLIENCLIVTPDAEALPAWRRTDVVVVPKARVEVLRT